jgi:hypothetical protein
MPCTLPKYIQYQPSSLLKDFVECYWICRAPANTLASVERLVPGGRTELIFNLGDTLVFSACNDLTNGHNVSHAHVLGQRNQVHYAKQNGHTHLLGVRLKPGGIHAFTKIPARYYVGHNA